MDLADSQRRTVRRLLRAFDDRDVRYVVLRGHERLPDGLAGSDLDLFVDPAAFDAAVAVCERELDAAESPLSSVVDLAALAAANPRRTVEQVVAAPGQVAWFVKQTLSASEFSDRGYVERAFRDGDGLVVDVVNHLAYTSPMDGSQIRVDPAVEASMLDHRRRRDGVCVPSPPDELLHLVCRGVFDYGGDFPARYRRRCDALADRVRADPEADERFRDLLSHVFFDADEVVYDAVADGDYGEIRSRLAAYADY